MDTSGTANDLAFAFLSIVLEGAPFIFFGTLVSGFIDAYLPPGLIDRWLPRKRTLAILMSGLLGAVFPVCECAIVPVIRRLVRKGLPVSCAVTYMLSAPIINPIVALSTWNAFSTTTSTNLYLGRGPEVTGPGPWMMTSSRLIIAFLITVTIGLVIQRIGQNKILRPSILAGVPPSRDDEYDHAHQHGHEAHEEDHDHDHDHEGHAHHHDHAEMHAVEPPPADSRLVGAMRTAMRDFLDTAMYFVIGVGITALFKATASPEIVTIFTQQEFITVSLMMGLAFLLSLCSTSDAFIAATFPVPVSAKLAFLIFGPMMDVKLVFMYLAVFRKKFVFFLAVTLFVAIGLICLAWA